MVAFLGGILIVAFVLLLQAWAAPPGWVPLLWRQVKGALHWARENWLSATAIGTAAAVAGVMAPFLIRWLDRRRPIQSARQTRDGQQRTVMLQRVRYKWITGVLEPSLADAAQLALGLERRTDLLDLGVRMIRRIGRPSEPLRSDTPISQVLDNIGGGLLIVGAPGAGKTTTLLQLCNELLDRAIDDRRHPVPVVFNLASWAARRPPLSIWLEDELVGSYQVPRSIATRWVEQDELVLLLDGLDEVAESYRAACAEAINAWRNEHGLVPLVVCSRTQELQALGARLRLEEAVELQPPSDADVNRYLGYLEATGTAIGEVRAALASDHELRLLLRSPLLLHVIALAYHGRPASALYGPGTLQQRQAWLWEAYVARMFEQRPLSPSSGYTDQQAVGWLASLARILRDRDATEFHLDRLAPDWLPTSRKQRRARVATGLIGGLAAGPALGLSFLLIMNAFGLSFGLGGGLIFGLVAGLVLGLLGGRFLGLAAGLAFSVEPYGQVTESRIKKFLTGLGSVSSDKQPASSNGDKQWSLRVLVAIAFGVGGGLAAGLVAGLVDGIYTGLAAALALGLGFGLTYGLVGVLTDNIEPAEQVTWSWLRLRAGLPRVVVGGLVGGMAFGLAFGLAGGLPAGLTFGSVFGLTVVLLGGLAAGLVGGLRDERAVPNEGIRRSAQHALYVGLAAGLTIGLSSGVTLGLVLGASTGLSVGLGFGLTVASISGMMFGEAACLQHYVVRAYLVRERLAPWRYSAFLAGMAQRLLLRRSGSAYLFAHRLLRDYLANMKPEHSQTDAAANTPAGQ
jgi:hypothetical protein